MSVNEGLAGVEGVQSEMQQVPLSKPLDADNDPPYSRVFVNCGKAVTEEQLQELFKACGLIQYPH